MIYYSYGLPTIGGIKSHLSISYAGKCLPGWKSFYNYEAPWRRWFKNPIFDNRSQWDNVLARHRVWFIFMWFIVTW